MRPKKRILLWSWDRGPMPADDCKFVLETRMYVSVARWHAGVAELSRVVREASWDLVIVQHTGEVQATRRAIKAVHAAGLRCLAIELAAGCPDRADETLPLGGKNIGLIESVARLSARKRGPRKGVSRVGVVAVAEGVA